MLKLIFSILFLASSILVTHAQSRLISRERFGELTTEDQNRVIIKTMELMVELEEKFERQKKTSSYDPGAHEEFKKFAKAFQNLLIDSALAAPSRQWRDYGAEFTSLINRSNGKQCVYAGWVSQVVGQYCTHPALLPASATEKKAYNQSACPNTNEISCNPVIFGFKQASKETLFCVPAGIANDNAHNAALRCMNKALSSEGDGKEARLAFLRANLLKPENARIVEDVYKYLNKTCVCPGSNPMNQKYHDYMLPHRTCYGLMNMLATTVSCEGPVAATMDTTFFKELQSMTVPEGASGPGYDEFYKSFLEKIISSKTSEFKNLCGEDAFKDAIRVGLKLPEGLGSGSTPSLGSSPGTKPADTDPSSGKGSLDSSYTDKKTTDTNLADQNPNKSSPGLTVTDGSDPKVGTGPGTNTGVPSTNPTTPASESETDGPDIVVVAGGGTRLDLPPRSPVDVIGGELPPLKLEPIPLDFSSLPNFSELLKDAEGDSSDDGPMCKALCKPKPDGKTGLDCKFVDDKDVAFTPTSFPEITSVASTPTVKIKKTADGPEISCDVEDEGPALKAANIEVKIIQNTPSSVLVAATINGEKGKIPLPYDGVLWFRKGAEGLAGLRSQTDGRGTASETAEKSGPGLKLTDGNPDKTDTDGSTPGADAGEDSAAAKPKKSSIPVPGDGEFKPNRLEVVENKTAKPYEICAKVLKDGKEAGSACTKVPALTPVAAPKQPPMQGPRMPGPVLNGFRNGIR